ncbi:hypothetical protein ASPWEDRAFT_39393 [Aspergillus wentii DTO 134E9]|uniref:Uncharacterized protein n=1 Tax=Aspergillus wentii DTO 134E9 TaxID=1073089 RepID=A0A1L9RRX4_ASPWE|nr:uncharacterized protein ASPWEDRAFT_39393 [Aspergillus wentii DTO 134E9]OJJ37662.1 hypothetical protein ASPWEDRAFT_39393 [Aspergillus wentii DTO 134E9]
MMCVVDRLFAMVLLLFCLVLCSNVLLRLICTYELSHPPLQPTLGYIGVDVRRKKNPSAIVIWQARADLAIYII